MMNQFATDSVISEDTFRELKKYLMPPAQKIALFTMIILAACLLIVSLIARWFGLAAMLAVVTIVFALEYVILLNKYVKTNSRKLRETINAAECQYTTSFSDSGLELTNHSTNATATIHYEHIKKFVETEHYYALFTAANQFGTVNRPAIDEAGKREELISFLRSNCKNIRW